MGKCVLDCDEDSYDGGEGECVPYFETCTESCEGVDTYLMVEEE